MCVCMWAGGPGALHQTGAPRVREAAAVAIANAMENHAENRRRPCPRIRLIH